MQKALTVICITAATFLLPALSAAQDVSSPPRLNVLLLVSDDQRPDTIGALGNSHIRTPNLDQLVARGTSFLRATCANPICTPSRAEILTGCSGFRNGVLDFNQKIRPEMPRMAEAMRTAGYRTCYVGKWHNEGRPKSHGYDESLRLYASGLPPTATHEADYAGQKVTGYVGWVFQDDEGNKFPEHGIGLMPDTSTKIAEGAIEFMERDSDEPFFLHVNFTAPHDPLHLPPGFKTAYGPKTVPAPPNFLPEHPFEFGNLRGRGERLLPRPRTREAVQRHLAAYYAVISHMDEQIGRILQTLDEAGQLENTLVIFTSDHGLGVGSHGIAAKHNMYEHTIGVPLVIAGPGIPENTTTNAQCYLRDLFPTICDLVKVAWPKTVEGLSLVPILNGEKQSVYSAIYGYFRDHSRMIRTDSWKLIDYPKINRRQLFDLSQDPHEQNDLSDNPIHAKMLQQLQEQLHTWQQNTNDPISQ